MRYPNSLSLPAPAAFFAVLVTLIFSLATELSAQIPAFPGAEGFGAYATGGRGGDVYYVTNLNSSGAGSLREGVETAPSSGRTIVFAVSGYIPLPGGSAFRMVQNKITIAGQTAPGDGIGLRNGTVRVTGNNTILRHLRLRHGRNGSGGDCLNLDSTATNSIIDHVSMMFSTDENISFFNSALDNFTMQYSTSSWGMERHNAGGLWDLQDGSCHHSLWAHHRTRNPKARPGMLEWINNVTFHWRNEGFIMGDSQTPGTWKANVIGNYYLSIDDPDTGYGLKNIGLSKAQVASNNIPNFSLHLDDCLHDADGDGLLNGTDKGYAIVGGAEFTPGDPVGANRYYKSVTPFTGATGSSAIGVDDPLTGYKKVLSAAGALRLDANYPGPIHDELDALLVDSIVNQYSVLVQKDGNVAGETTPNNGEQNLANTYGITNYGFGTLNGTTPPTDSDLDGMPDSWEIALNGKDGMSFNLALDDHNTVFTSGQIPNTFFPSGTPTGYTYLEEYLHFLAVPHAMVAKSTVVAPSSQTVDLRKYTGGFSDTPAFTITNVSANGSIEQFLADGTTPSATGPIVKFTPTDNEVGRAGFDFTVVDADTSTWTQQFALLILAAAAPLDLVWIGDDSANAWDDSSVNWELSGGTPTAFSVGDTALFDDRGSASPALTVTGTLTAGSVLFTGTQNYTIGGTGTIASTGTLTKAGDTTLTLNTSTSFSQGTSLNGGTTVLNGGGNIAGGAIKFTGGSTLTSAYNSSSTLSLNPSIEVSSGAVGNINLSQRVNLNGSLSGGGTFNIYSPSNLGTEGRVYFNGASAGCTGTVNLSGGATAPGNGGRVSFRANGGSFNGFGNATLNLMGIDLFTTNNSTGNTYAIGALSGDANSRLRSNYSGNDTTWEVGALNASTTFAGVIMNGTAPTHLTKWGTGTLTLSGANTHTGGTNINWGTLHLTGSLGGTAVTLNNVGTLTGSGSIAGSVTAQSGSTLAGTSTISGAITTSSATVSPGDAPGDRGLLTAAGGFSGTNSTLTFDLSNSPAGNNDRIFVTSGSGYLAGTNTFVINLADGVLGSGSYKLIDCDTLIPMSVQGGMVMNLQMNAPGTTRQSFGLQRTASGTNGGYVRLNVTGDASSLVWTGASGSNWDLNTTSNFNASNTFYNLDKIDFDDTASTGNVTVVGDLSAREIVVWNHVVPYVFDATSGSLAGPGSLVKTGAQSLTINASGTGNTFTGGTTIYDGTLAVSGTSPLGTGTITMHGGTLALPNTAVYLSNSMVFVSGSSTAISSPYNGNSTIMNSTSNTMSSLGDATVDLSGVSGILSMNGSMDGFSGTVDFGAGSGMLRLNSNSSPSQDVNFGSTNTHFDLGIAGGALSNRNGDIAIDFGALSGGGSTSLSGRQSGSGNTSTTYRVGALNTDTTFAGSIYNGGDNLGVHLIKQGTGKWTLSGTSNYVGSMLVEAGTLAVSGSLTSTETLQVESGAALDLLGGTIATDTEIASGATFTGAGTINGELVNDGTVTADGSTLTVTGSVVNNGTIVIKSSGELVAAGSFVNYGVLDLLTAQGALPANLVNNGVVIDSSGLEVVDAAIQDLDFELTIMTYSGHSYQFQYSDSLTGAWTSVGAPVVGDGSQMVFVHSSGVSGTKRFYRMAVD